jgi:hypothetical protein
MVPCGACTRFAKEDVLLRGKTDCNSACNRRNEVEISFAVYEVERQLEGMVLRRDVGRYVEAPDISQYPKLF